AEDGIRDGHVTGVQTCALPIWIGTGPRVALIGDEVDHLPLGGVHRRVKAARSRRPGVSCSRSRWTPRRRSRARAGPADLRISAKIGRARVGEEGGTQCRQVAYE